jgi:hypothetical protein
MGFVARRYIADISDLLQDLQTPDIVVLLMLMIGIIDLLKSVGIYE